MHDEDVATAAKRWSPESVIHDRVFRQNASMCYDILLWVAVHSHFHRLAAVATTSHENPRRALSRDRSIKTSQALREKYGCTRQDATHELLHACFVDSSE